MNSSDVNNVKFTVTKFREGYALQEVDDFLDGVRQALAAWESGRLPALGSDSVAKAVFSTTKFRAGYDQVEVDSFLDNVFSILRRYETGQGI